MNVKLLLGSWLAIAAFGGWLLWRELLRFHFGEMLVSVP